MTRTSCASPTQIDERDAPDAIRIRSVAAAGGGSGSVNLPWVASLWCCKYGSRSTVSLGGGHLLGQGLFGTFVACSFEVLAVKRGEVDAVGLVGDE